MKTITANFTDERDYRIIGGTKTRITLSQYDEDWNLDSDTDLTDNLISFLPDIDIEMEDDLWSFKAGQLNIDFEDQNHSIRDAMTLDDKHFLIKIEKGFDDVADWVVIFDGLISTYDTFCKGRNITSITAYSMESELELNYGSESTNYTGIVNLSTHVGDLLDLSNINIPVGNRTIDVVDRQIDGEFADWTARKSLDELAKLTGSVWWRPERDTAYFVSRHYIGGTRNLDTDLYQPKYKYYWVPTVDGVSATNGTDERESGDYQLGNNIEVDSSLISPGSDIACCRYSEETWSFTRFKRRIFTVPAFFLIEMEPMDRVNLTLRDVDGAVDETIFTQVTGLSYSDTDKITRLKLEERRPRCYEKWQCCDNCGGWNIFGNNWSAQTFTLGTEGYDRTHDCVHVKLPMCRTGTPGQVNIALYDTLAGVPNIQLKNKNLNLNTITTCAVGWEWVQFDFSVPYQTFNAATQYAIVASAALGDAANFVNWRHEHHAGGALDYGGGHQYRSFDGGVNWTRFADYDHNFEEWGED